MLKALSKSKGIVSTAAEKVGVGRTTHYKWIKEHPEYAEAVLDIDEACLDTTESKLHENIKAGKEASIFFHLKCKGKKRGFIERQEIEQQINVEHTGKVVTYRLPDNGRDPHLKKAKEGDTNDSNDSDEPSAASASD